MKIATFKASNTPFQMRLPPIGMNNLRGILGFIRDVGHINLPTQAVNHGLPSRLIPFKASHKPALPAILMVLGRQGDLDQPGQTKLGQQLVKDLTQLI